MKSQCVAVFAMLFVACVWSAMTGGLKEVDVNDESVQNLANFAVNRHNMVQNDLFRRDIVKVVKAQAQVVSGMKYIITVNMGRTDCRKNRANESCGAITENFPCTFTVWSRPWLNEIKLMHDTCSESSTSM